MISDFRRLEKNPSRPKKFKRPQRDEDHGSSEKGLHVQKSRSCCEQWFSKAGAKICVQDRKSFFSSGGQTKVMFGNEMKINKLAP